MRIACILLCCLVLFSCNNKPKKSFEEIQREEQEYNEKQKAKEDSVKKAKHAEIEKNLSKTDGGHIIGDIYLGMSKNDFEIAYKKFKDEVGQIDIDGTKFRMMRNESLMFDEGKLVRFCFGTSYTRTMKLPSKGGSISDVKINDPGGKIKSNVYTHLYKKYGEADSISKDFDYVRWEYSFKIIEIADVLSTVSAGYGGETEDYHDLYIVFSDPITFKREEFVKDSIQNEQSRIKKEKYAKEKAYSEQL